MRVTYSEARRPSSHIGGSGGKRPRTPPGRKRTTGLGRGSWEGREAIGKEGNFLKSITRCVKQPVARIRGPVEPHEPVGLAGGQPATGLADSTCSRIRGA